MINFKKVINLKPVCIILSIIFLLNTPLYSCSSYQDTLRVPSSFWKQKTSQGTSPSLPYRRGFLRFAAVATAVAMVPQPFFAMPAPYLNNVASSDIYGSQSIKFLLERFGYPPENSLGQNRPLISEQYDKLNGIIESYARKYEDIKKISPEKYGGALLNLVRDLRSELRDRGYSDLLHPFLQSLVSNLDSDEDIFQSIAGATEIQEETRKRLMEELTFCTSKAQQCNMLLRLIRINGVRSVFAPNHSTIAIFLGNDRYLFADFALNIFMIIDLPVKFYKDKGRWFLKNEYKIPPEKLFKLKQQYAREGLALLSKLKEDEVLNLVYPYLYIVFEDRLADSKAETDSMSGSTLAMHVKRGLTYDTMGSFYRDSNPGLSQSYYVKAEREYRKAIKIDSKCAEAHENFAILLNHMGNMQEAIAEYMVVLKLNDKKATVYSNLGAIYADLRNWEKAAEEHRKAVELDPNSGIAYANLGDAYVNLGKYEDALDMYIKGIALMPEDPSLHFGLGLVYYNLKKYKEALKEFEKAMKIDPGVSATPYHIGLTYYQLGDLKKAGKFFDAAIKINENFYEAYLYRGWVYYKAGDSNKAINAWAEAYLIKKSLKLNIKDLPPEIENLPADVADAVKKLVDSTNLTPKRKISLVLPFLFGLKPARDIARQAM